MNRQAKLRLQFRRKGVHFFRFKTHGVVHVVRVTQHKIRWPPGFHHCHQSRPPSGWLRIDQSGQRRGHADFIAVTESDPPGAIINAKTTHGPDVEGPKARRNFICASGYFTSLTFMTALSADELSRYSRHILLGELGAAGQQKLKAARVLVIGAGGLGSPVALYLAAAGVGTLGIADLDRVELHNLQRQLLHDTASVGEAKVDSAVRHLRALNPLINLVAHTDGITADNARAIFTGYDLIVDGTDNFRTRYLANDAAFFTQKPLVSGSIFKFEGQVTIFDSAQGGPCCRCLFPEVPAAGTVPGCGEAGVLGALCGVIGSLQALEVIKLITGLGESLKGRLLTYNALTQSFSTFSVPRSPTCSLCGPHPTIRDLSAHAAPPPCNTHLSMNSPDTYPLELSIEETQRLLTTTAESVVLLDVREAHELEICQIPRAVHIPMRQIPDQIDTLPRDKHILVHCHHGGRSMRVTEYLRNRGFIAVSNVGGGIDAWAETFDPAMRRY